MVATWKTQAAPTFDAALRAAQQANESISEGGADITAGLGEVLQAPEDAIMNQAKTALMNLDTDQAREEFLLENPSSFHDADKLQTFRDELMKNDGAREKESHKLTLLGQSEILDSIKDPVERKRKMGEYQYSNDLKGINDDEGMHKARMNKMLGNQQFTVTRKTIEQAGGNPDDELTFNEDVEQRVFDIIDKNIRSQYYGASAATIEAKRNDALAASPWGAMFTRRTKRREKMTDLDIQSETLAHAITDNIGGQSPESQAKLVDSVNQAMNFYLTNATQLSDQQKQWLQGPILKALDGEGIDATKRWFEINANHDVDNPGSVKNQKRFGREISRQLKNKFPTLDQKIIDTHIGDLLARSGLGEMIGKGNTIYKYQQKLDKEFMDAVSGLKRGIVDDLIQFRNIGVAATVRQDLEAAMNKRWGKDEKGKSKVTGIERNDLITQTAATVKKIKSAFINSELKSTLTKTQEATLDLAIHRFLTTTVGYDPDSGYIPFDSADWVIATLGGYLGQGKDMSNNSINSLLEGVKEHLPQVGDRLEGAQAEGAVLLESMIAKYQRANPGTAEQEKIDNQLKDIKAKRDAAAKMTPRQQDRT
jgi:hypothetical protein